MYKSSHALQAAHRVVAAAALRRGTGARGLRSLLDSLLRDALYHVRGPMHIIPDPHSLSMWSRRQHASGLE